MCGAEEAASAPRRAKLVFAVAQPRRCLGDPDESPRQVAYLCVGAVSKRLPGTSELSRSLRRGLVPRLAHVLLAGPPSARLSSHCAGQWWCGSAAASARRHSGRTGRWLWTACAGKHGGHLLRVRRGRLSQNAAEQLRWCLPCCLRQCLQLGFAPHSHAAQRLRSGH